MKTSKPPRQKPRLWVTSKTGSWSLVTAFMLDAHYSGAVDATRAYPMGGFRTFLPTRTPKPPRKGRTPRATT